MADSDVPPPLAPYRRYDEDNGRWEGFTFRSGDVIINAPAKSGTTWTQLLVALLVFDGPDFPEPIGRMSPCMELPIGSVQELHAILERQTHRRFIKSHTPLDGIPMRDEVHYVCVGRDPRDAALSMLAQGDNMNWARLAELIGQGPTAPDRAHTAGQKIDRWIDGGLFPEWSVRSLFHHYRTFWEQRHNPKVALFHFSDYLHDLPREILRLAAHLDIEITEEQSRGLAKEASLERARARAGDIAPEAHLGVLKDPSRFFRSGVSGEWRNRMTPDQKERYEQLAAAELEAGLASWIHHE